jgi:hypothetical protein
MEWTEIIINVQDDKLTQIVFLINGFIEFVEPFEIKHHSQYLNLDITVFKF